MRERGEDDLRAKVEQTLWYPSGSIECWHEAVRDLNCLILQQLQQKKIH